jgi:hypothetical protein
MDLFDPQDGSKRPNPSVEKTINTLVDREVADIRKMRRTGDFVLKNLRRFEAWTVDDESAVKREKISLERGLEGHQGFYFQKWILRILLI